MNKISFLLFLLLLSFFVTAQVEKQDTTLSPENEFSIDPINSEVEESIFDLDEPLDITLTYDITSFIKNKGKGEYTKATFQAHYAEETITKNIKLKARGNFRRGHCFFPPIHLNFKKDPIENTEFEGINKIKLVTHCSTSKSAYKYILREFMAYKLYNIISENSFRVRLLDIEYKDTGTKDRNYQQIGFIIEPIKLLAKRKNHIVVNEEAIRCEHVIPQEADIIALFQYMIGNTDWRIKGGHNTKFIKSLSEVTGLVSPVPYDFDFSGLVNAPYAHPQEWSNVEKITERDYLGYCRNEENYHAAIRHFLDREDKIYETINTFTYLEERDRKQMLRYIEDFYAEIKRTNRIINLIKHSCRNTDF